MDPTVAAARALRVDHDAGVGPEQPGDHVHRILVPFTPVERHHAQAREPAPHHRPREEPTVAKEVGGTRDRGADRERVPMGLVGGREQDRTDRRDVLDPLDAQLEPSAQHRSECCGNARLYLGHERARIFWRCILGIHCGRLSWT